MADRNAVGKGETSRKRHGYMDNGAVLGRAEKKLRATKTSNKSSQKRSWTAMAETDTFASNSSDPSVGGRVTGSLWKSVDGSPLHKVLRTVSLKEGDGEAIDAKGSELLDKDDTSFERENEGSSELEGLKRESKTEESLQGVNLGGAAESAPDISSTEDAETGSAQEGKEVEEEEKRRRHMVVRKGLRKVKLKETGRECVQELGSKSLEEGRVSNAFSEEDDDGILLCSREEVLKPQEKKRKANKKRDESPKHPGKKARIEIVEERQCGVPVVSQAREDISKKRTWTRLVRENSKTESASEDMGVLVSDAWKRLREEKSSGSSGDSVNAQSDSDLSMHSVDSVEELVKRNPKKVRYEQTVTFQGKKWRRRNRGTREGSTSKRPREDITSDSSTSAGSDGAQTYLHNRIWKRPRFENLMSVQGRSRRSIMRDVEVIEQSTRKRSQNDASARLRKRQHK